MSRHNKHITNKKLDASHHGCYKASNIISGILIPIPTKYRTAFCPHCSLLHNIHTVHSHTLILHTHSQTVFHFLNKSWLAFHFSLRFVFIYFLFWKGYHNFKMLTKVNFFIRNTKGRLVCEHLHCSCTKALSFSHDF